MSKLPKCRDVVCSICRETYHTASALEEMHRELQMNFCRDPKDGPLMEVCDNCYKKVRSGELVMSIGEADYEKSAQEERRREFDPIEYVRKDEIAEHISNELPKWPKWQEAHMQQPDKLIPVKATLLELPFYESITRANDGETGKVIRVWRRCETLPEYPDMEVIRAIEKIPADSSMQEAIDLIVAVGKVTAIELTTKDGFGAVIYLEW